MIFTANSQKLIIAGNATAQVQKLSQSLQLKNWQVVTTTKMIDCAVECHQNKVNCILLSTNLPDASSYLEIANFAKKENIPVVTFDESLVPGVLGEPSDNGALVHMGNSLNVVNFMRSYGVAHNKLKNPGAPGVVHKSADLYDDKHFIAATVRSDLLPQKSDKRISYEPIKKSLSTALRAVVGGAGQANPGTLRINNKSNCVYVEAAEFSGYLISSFGGECEIEGDLQRDIISATKEFLISSQRIKASFSKVNATMPEADMQVWAQAHAEFVQFGAHEGITIGVAFVAAPKELPIAKGATTDFLMIDTKNLISDQEIGFDLYHYLPLNKRYVKFSHKGKLDGFRMDRIRHKAKAMHFNASDLDAAKKYVRENYLMSLRDQNTGDAKKNLGDSPQLAA